MLARLVAMALGAAIVVQPAAGQGEIIIDTDDGAQAAYFALTTTPIGALPSWVVYQLGDASRRGTGVRAHFGNIDEEGDFARRSLALGVDLRLGAGTVGLTGGYHDLVCDEQDLENQFPGASIEVDCGGGFILGANWASPLTRSSLGASGATSFVLGLDVSLGFGMGDVLQVSLEDPGGDDLDVDLGATSFSASVGLPLLLTARSGNVIFVPHLTPRAGFGHASFDVDSNVPGEDADSESESGFRAMLGGGVGILFERSGFGFDVGFQKVFVDEGKLVIGVGVRQLFGTRS
ncbi:MAG TPA: hypothetical protein VJ596_11750 [Gemmatimonadaceae bacterium]|nr:hypothetical protein [Gemmatimonadaceae bacterium]